MDARDRELLVALAYAGALPWPLTLAELQARTGGALSDVVMRTDALVAAGLVRAAHGMYLLSDIPDELLWRRIVQQKECAQKWTRMLRYARWLQAVPFVRMLCASGSLALGNADPESDWDIFVIARAGRLYTARAGLLLVAWCMGRLRTKRMRAAPDLFCFHHLITTDGLAIRQRGVFMAHALAGLIPIHDPQGYLMRLWQANHWIDAVIPCLAGRQAHAHDATWVRHTVQPSRILNAVRSIAEVILGTYIGFPVEWGLRTWMQRRITRTPATHEPGGRVVADMRELEFHPHSCEGAVMVRYQSAVDRIDRFTRFS